MSALHSKADIRSRAEQVRFVPTADISTSAENKGHFEAKLKRIAKAKPKATK
jgi:hypothetical protein